MSFGDSWFAGTHTRNKEKISTRHNRNTQKTSSYVTLTRWAHLIENTDVQSPGTDIHKMGAHQAVSRMKGGAKMNKVGPAELQVRLNLDVHPSRCILAGDSLLSS